jgi:hypothetical protein
MGTANSQDVLDLGVRYLTTAVAPDLQKDASVRARFEGARAPANVTAGLIMLTSR